MSILPINYRLLTELNVEALTARLQQKRAPAVASAAPTTTGEGSTGEDQQPAATATTATSASDEKEEKLRLWNDLKILSFTRTVSSVYLVVLLSMLTHLQLNLLGRFIYLDSVVQIDAQTSAPVVSLDEGEDAKPSLDAQTEKQYLLFSAYLLTDGWKKLVDRVRVAVEESIGNLGLRQPVTYDDLITYIENIRVKVEVEEHPSADAFGRGTSGSSTIPRGFPHQFKQYLLPATGSPSEIEVLRSASHNPDELITPQLASLLDTSHRLLEQRDFTAVLRSALDDSFEILLKSLKHPTFFPDVFPGPRHSTLSELADNENPTQGLTGEEKSLSPPLASILPPITRQVHQVVHSGLPNEYLRAIEMNVSVRGWSAVVYAGWESETRQVGQGEGQEGGDGF